MDTRGMLCASLMLVSNIYHISAVCPVFWACATNAQCCCMVYRRGNQVLIKIGDKEVDFSPDFKLYITTKLANPHYTPEVSTKAMIVNFAVKEQGLEAQLLNTVVKMERPDLDKQKNDLVVKVCSHTAC